jgi:hypothetical protein
VNEFLLFVFLGATAYTIGRVIALDSLFEEWRDAYLDWVTLDTQRTDPAWNALPVWRRKAATVVTCPHCVTAYPSAVGVVVVDVWFQDLAMPVLWWFGAWSLALLLWAAIDSD